MKKAIFLLFSILISLLLFSCDSEGGSESSSESSESSEESTQGTSVSVKYEASEGGSIEGKSEQSMLLDGEAGVASFAQVTATPSDGYYFVSWSDGLKNPTRKDKLSKDTTLKATFAPATPVVLEYRAGEGGSIEGTAIQNIFAGQSGTSVRAIASEGYRFTGWSDGRLSSFRADKGTESAVYIANFTPVYTVEFKCNSNMGYIKGSSLQSVDVGKECNTVTAVAAAGYKFVGWDNGSSEAELKITPESNTTVTAIFERVALDMPILSIDTKDSIAVTSKEDYLGCKISVSNAEQEFNFELEYGKIRGRGNTSWESPKKSYKLKFDNEVDLFGNGEAREWALISNYFDLSLVRNFLAYSAAIRLPALSGSTTKTQFVELFLNGEYLGVYLVCEQVEIHENRLNLNQSSDLDTGYLLELDSRGGDNGFFLMAKFHQVKSPNFNDAFFTKEHMTFIRDYVNKSYNAALYGEYSEVEALIDTESFAQAYVIYEIFKCVDVGYASFNIYKDAGGKLTCGPVWDFDRSMGNVGNNESARRYDSLWARKDNIWFAALFKHEEFETLVCEVLEEYLPEIQNALSDAFEYLEAHPQAFERNFEKWDILGTYVYPNPSELNRLQTWQEQVEFNKSYLEKSIEFMLKTYPTNKDSDS